MWKPRNSRNVFLLWDEWTDEHTEMFSEGVNVLRRGFNMFYSQWPEKEFL